MYRAKSENVSQALALLRTCINDSEDPMRMLPVITDCADLLNELATKIEFNSWSIDYIDVICEKIRLHAREVI